MRYIAIAVMMFAIILVVANEKVMGDRNDARKAAEAAAVSPFDTEFLTLSEAETDRLTRQMEIIAARLMFDRNTTSSLVNRSILGCVPTSTKAFVVSALTDYVIILSETTQLPERQRQADIAERMIALGTEFDSWLINQPDAEQERIYKQLVAYMNKPVKLFNCNDYWLIDYE